MRVSVFGLGYVGAVSAACLARDGHTVIGCDIDETKLALLRQGRSPISEPGMGPLVAAVVGSGQLRITNGPCEAVAQSDVSLVCVGTPANPDGKQDLSALERLAVELGAALSAKDAQHLVAVRSTVLPGTMQTVFIPLLEEHARKRTGSAIHVAFVPEFLREGSSISDYDSPPFTIAGVEGGQAAAILRDLYGHLPADFLVTSIPTAEVLKYCCNTFHALKVTFANEIGRLAQALEVNAGEVMDLFCRDQRLNLSGAYLRPGFAFGGPCLPKDMQALLHLAEQRHVQAPLLSAILASNEIQIDVVVEAVLRAAPKTVGLLGLSFKSGTDDLRSSPFVVLAQRLLARGCTVRAYDPAVDVRKLLGANRRAVLEALPDLEAMMVSDPNVLAAECDVLVLGRSDPAVVEALAAHAKGRVVIDIREARVEAVSR